MPNRNCPNVNCLNRGLLVLDANIIFYIIEGTIRYVQDQFPDLITNADRLPQILQELDAHFMVIKNYCSQDGVLNISSQVLFDEVVDVDPREKDLAQLSKYTRRRVAQIMQVVTSHFPNHNAVLEQEIQDLRGIFNNPDNRPDILDASLIVLACHLGLNGQKSIVLTSDPDFENPIKYLMAQSTIDLLGNNFPTNQLMYRDYFGFIRRLHDCCNLNTERYNSLAVEYHAALVNRLVNLDRQNVINRNMDILNQMWNIHTISIQYK